MSLSLLAFGIFNICFSTIILLVTLWIPRYKYPLLPILMIIISILWVAYALLADDIIIAISNAIHTGIIIVFFFHSYYKKHQSTPWQRIEEIVNE